MILLEPGNRILEETLGNIINPPEPEVRDEDSPEAKREPIDVRLCDFDDVSYRITIEAERTNVLILSLAAPCIGQIMDKGAAVAIQKFYGDYKVEAQGGFDVTLEIPLDGIKEDKAALVKRLALIKPNVIGGVFEYFIDKLNSGAAPEGPFQFRIRNDTTVYTFPAADRVVFIYSMDYQDKAENCIAKVFMQEFVAVKKSVGKAPPVTFSAVPPRELQEQLDIKESNCNLGYISFAILKPHVDTDLKRTRVSQLLQDFRTYMQYHIKCSKSYFHSRMRARTVELLKVLSRAKVTAEDEQGSKKIKRTAGGKVFQRN
jgi:actin related protein 2/3 complex subunit 2